MPSQMGQNVTRYKTKIHSFNSHSHSFNLQIVVGGFSCVLLLLGMRGDVGWMRGDMGWMLSDVGWMRGDVGWMLSDVGCVAV